MELVFSSCDRCNVSGEKTFKTGDATKGLVFGNASMAVEFYKWRKVDYGVICPECQVLEDADNAIEDGVDHGSSFTIEHALGLGVIED